MNYRNDMSRRNRSDYKKMVEKSTPNSPMAINILKAFLVGGIICCIGQVLRDIAAGPLKLNAEGAGMFTSVVLVFLGATLTGVGLYDKLGRWAGAGSAVPITGFANSVVSPAMEFKHEGWVMGTGSKIFTIAGPVIACGVTSSVVVGLIYWVLIQMGVA